MFRTFLIYEAFLTFFVSLYVTHSKKCFHNYNSFVSFYMFIYTSFYELPDQINSHHQLLE